MMEMADSSPTNGLHSGLPHLLVLPEELKKSLVAFLTAHDIASLVQTCKMLHNSHHYSFLSPPGEYINVVTTGGSEPSRPPFHAGQLDLMLKQRIHSVCFECEFRDSGNDQRTEKGRVYIVAERSNVTGVASAEPFGGGRVVYESPLPTRSTEKFVAWFTPRVDEKYSIWIKTSRGGSRHFGYVACTLHFYCADDQERSLRKIFGALMRSKVFPIHPERSTFFCRVLQTAIKKEIKVREMNTFDDRDSQASDEGASELLVLFQSYKIPTTLSGLKVLQEIFDEPEDSAIVEQPASRESGISGEALAVAAFAGLQAALQRAPEQQGERQGDGAGAGAHDGPP